jgi:hypothetical protein
MEATVKSTFRILAPMCLAASILSNSASAGTIDYPCTTSSGCSFQYVAADDPTNGNVWTGLSESFTAQDPNVLAGFYVFNPTGTSISDPLLFSLYTGNGTFSTLLGSVSATATLASDTSELLEVNFSSIPLTPGNQYTLAVTLPSQGLPVAGPGSYQHTGTGEYSQVGVFINSESNSYPGGQFYYLGSSYSESFFANWDLAFNVTPVASATPEPGTWLLVGTGLGVLARVRRRRQHRTA